MRPADQTEYIVQAIREGASMYEDDARAFLAEHDTHIRTEALAEAAAVADEHAARMVDRLTASALRTVADEQRHMAGGEKATPTGATATPDFFQPGRTYRSRHDGYTAPELIITFRVEHVTHHPDRGHLRAIGWMRTGEPGTGWHGDFRDESEYDVDGWTDVTGCGETQ